MSLKYKLSTESHRKINDFEAKDIQQTRISETLCMDTYKNIVTPKVSQMKLDLFTGLNQTVKVMQIIFIQKVEYLSIYFKYFPDY